jgi:AraC family transcriptional regulator
MKQPWAGPIYVEALSVAIAARSLVRGAGVQFRPAVTRGNSARIAKAIEYAESNLDTSIGLADMAAAACLSVFHFSRCFREVVGLAPHAWLMRRRIERAQSLLASTGAPLAEVAYSCGFSSQSHFTSAFRSRVGVTPGAYRRSRQL